MWTKCKQHGERLRIPPKKFFKIVDNVDNFSEIVSLFYTRYKIRYKYSFHYIMPIIRAKYNLFVVDCAKINYIFKYTLVLIKVREG